MQEFLNELMTSLLVEVALVSISHVVCSFGNREARDEQSDDERTDPRADQP